VAQQVRELLDKLGAHRTRIVVTGDLDEHSIAALAAAPVNGYGVGTALVTGSGAPTAALVYKLVARALDAHGDLRPVAKRSVGKPSKGGRKWAVRQLGDGGTAEVELITLAPPGAAPKGRALLRQLVRGGEIVGREPLQQARERHQHALAELPPHALQLSRGYPAIPTAFDPNND
jgi:nicotinate phosphoribosyltransferase